MAEKKNQMEFEEAYALLQQAVEKLENPKNTIEENIALYERACELVLVCRKTLEKAQLKITDINERIAQMAKRSDDLTEES